MRVFGFVFFLAGALLAAEDVAQAQKQYGPGVSDTEIKIGQNAPFSGPGSSYGFQYRVMAAYLDALNARGGVNGRRILLIQKDDGYSPPKTAEVIRQLVENEDVLAIVGSFGTPTNAAIQKYLNLKKVPHLLIQSGASRWNDPEHFPWTTPYSPFYVGEGRAIGHFLLEEYGGKKIGALYQADDVGRDFMKGLREGLKAEAPTMIVKEVNYQATDPTIDSQIVALKSAGTDIVFLAAQNRFAAQAIRKIAELGWKPQIISTSIANSVKEVLVPAGEAASTGLISTTSYKTPSDPALQRDAGVQEYLSFLSKAFPGHDPDDIAAIRGFSVMEAAAEILRRCGDNLTRENVLKQATNLRGLRLSLLMEGVTIQTAPGDYSAIRQIQLIRFDGEKWVKLRELIDDE